MAVQRKYKIGDWVLVHSTTHFRYNGDKREVYQRAYSEPFAAQVTGAVYRQLGNRVSISFEEGFTFEPNRGSTILVWKVRRGVTNIETDVLESDMEFCLMKHKLPWQYKGKGWLDISQWTISYQYLMWFQIIHWNHSHKTTLQLN